MIFSIALVIKCLHRSVAATVPICIAVKQGPILSNTIIPPSRDAEDMEVPGWVKSSAKMLNGGIEGQDWLALAKKLGELTFHSQSLHSAL